LQESESSVFFVPEKATDGSLASENWALNIEICDRINESSEGLVCGQLYLPSVINYCFQNKLVVLYENYMQKVQRWLSNLSPPLLSNYFTYEIFYLSQFANIVF